LQGGVEFIEQAGGIGFLHDLDPKVHALAQLPWRRRRPAAQPLAQQELNRVECPLNNNVW
jgi:hypothetical protein